MVDFQSRETRRGLEADEPASDSPTADDESAQATDGDASDAEPRERSDSTDRGVAVVSISREPTIEDDPAGDAVVEEIDRAGGDVVTRQALDASFDGVQGSIDSVIDRRDVYAVVTVGGTSVEPDDVTIEAIRPMLEKVLPGFGELLRRICFDDAGPAVVRTRATAGVLDGVAVFSLPGDADLARRATRDIVVHEAESVAALAAEPDS